jgi:simple sugar transport system substrate-binding protein
MHGMRVRRLIEMLENGETPEKLSYVDEEIFSAQEGITQLTVGEKTYTVTILTP